MGQVFKSRPSKICGRRPLKNFTWSTLEYFVPSKRPVTIVMHQRGEKNAFPHTGRGSSEGMHQSKQEEPSLSPQHYCIYSGVLNPRKYYVSLFHICR